MSIEPGSSYRLGSYQSPEREAVTVTKVCGDTTGWYDDHQGGGYESRGVVWFTFDDDDEPFWESIEYALDNWCPVE